MSNEEQDREGHDERLVALRREVDKGGGLNGISLILVRHANAVALKELRVLLATGVVAS